ncbi:MAG: T9SS type A sorting domain-containing protein [Prolixibacteraceae bacterium]|nr:T9SS type A sorting domain-containing protein [Prolixibacteraceae bacterium]
MKKYFIGVLLIAIQLSTSGNYNGHINLMEKKLTAMFDKLQAINVNKLKSVQVNENKLDSILFDDGGRKLFYYNENGQVTDFKNYVVDWDDEPAVLKEHQHYEYDENGNNTLYILYYLDSFDGWIEKEKYEYKYDAAGNQIEQVYWDYDQNEMTAPVRKESYLYDGNEMTVNDYAWIESDEDWELTGYYTIETDGEGNMLSGEGYEPSEETGEMIKAVILEYEYDTDGRLLVTDTKMYDPEQDEWVNVSYLICEYNTDGQLIFEKETMDFMGDAVVLYEYRFTYDADGLLVKKEEYATNWGTGELYMPMYYEYIYNGDVLSSQNVYFYDAGEMKQQARYEYSFIAGANVNDYLLPEIDPYYDDNSVYSNEDYSYGILGNLTKYSLSWNSDDLIVSYEATYYYSGGGSSVVLSSDATLASVEMDGANYDEFSGSVYSYEIELPSGISEVPEISVVANHAAATVNTTKADGIPGTTIVSVIAEDGTSVNYEFNFTVGTSSDKHAFDKFEVYPVPFNNQLTIAGQNSLFVAFDLYSMAGQKVKARLPLNANGENVLYTEDLEQGVYFLRLYDKNGKMFSRKVIKQ